MFELKLINCNEFGEEIASDKITLNSGLDLIGLKKEGLEFARKQGVTKPNWEPRGFPSMGDKPITPETKYILKITKHQLLSLKLAE